MKPQPGVALATVALVAVVAGAAGLRACPTAPKRHAESRGAPVETRYIIRTTRLAHCKRGPERCETCQKMDIRKICLLDIEPPDQGTIQRRVIEVTVNGEKSWREYDVVRTFAVAEEARAYAAANGITDIEVSPED